MEVLPKRLEVGDAVLTSLLGNMSRREHERNVAKIVRALTMRIEDTGDPTDLERRVIHVQDLRSRMECAAPGIFKFGQECFSQDAVGFVAKEKSEDDGNLVVRRLDVNNFLIAVVDHHYFTFRGSSCGLVKRGASLFGKSAVCVEGFFEGRGHGVAAE